MLGSLRTLKLFCPGRQLKSLCVLSHVSCYSSDQKVWHSVQLTEKLWGSYPKTYMTKAALLSAQIDRMTIHNDNMQRQLTLLQQHQNISGSGSFPLEYEAISKYLNPAVESFSHLYSDCFLDITAEYDERLCQEMLSCEIVTMLRMMLDLIEGRYKEIQGKMLEVLGGFESVENASKATTSFLDSYCQRHWERLFIGQDLNDQVCNTHQLLLAT